MLIIPQNAMQIKNEMAVSLTRHVLKAFPGSCLSLSHCGKSQIKTEVDKAKQGKVNAK